MDPNVKIVFMGQHSNPPVPSQTIGNLKQRLPFPTPSNRSKPPKIHEWAFAVLGRWCGEDSGRLEDGRRGREWWRR